MPTTSLGWGLIGASTIAQQYMIPAINRQSSSRCVAVMSRSPERGRAYAESHGLARSYDALGPLLADPEVDVVYISTTNERHHAEVLAAAAAGKHVLCEKPLALTLQDAHEMVHACRSAGVVMGTNHHLRNAATHRAIRRLIRQGQIGQPLAARVFHAVYLPPHLQHWRIKDPTTGAGVVLDITVHDTDTLRFLLDDEVESVVAITSQQGLAHGTIEDAVMGVMHFKQGVMAQFHDAFTVKHAGNGLEIHGTEGSIFARNVMTQEPVGTVELHSGDTVKTVAVGPDDGLYAHAVTRFNQAVRGHGQPWATGEDGVHSLAVGLAVLDAARTGQRTTVRYA